MPVGYKIRKVLYLHGFKSTLINIIPNKNIVPLTMHNIPEP